MASSTGTLDSAHLLLAGTADWVDPLAKALETRRTASVRTVETVDAAMSVLDEHPIDCVVTAQDLDDQTGLELLQTIRSETATLPVVLCTASGTEAIASKAIAADVTDYLVISFPVDDILDELLTRLSQSVRSSRRTITQRDRARQFDQHGGCE